jgi:hypothetical protein
MTDPKTKDTPTVTTRTPRKKVTTGIFDNLRPLPQPHPVEEILGLTQPDIEYTPTTPSSSSTPSRGTSSSSPSRGGRASKSSIAPERDFTKTANSIVRQAVPTGIFGEQGGKSKELYDTLYHLTRGAVVPRRKIRIPKDELMKKAGIGSEVTLRKNLQRLKGVGLIEEVIVPGMHGGNEYEVFMPEEVGLTGSTPSTPSSPSTGSNTRQNREGVEALDSTGSSPGLSHSESESYSEDKTFSLRPQRTIDDEAFAGLVRDLRQATLDVTGREPTAADSARWQSVGEVLVTELKIIAARTNVVSSAPAVLNEHLRRRLGKAESRAVETPAVSTEQNKPKVNREFTNELCPVCKGALTEADPDGGKRRCTFCRDNVGYPTGRKPKEDTE